MGAGEYRYSWAWFISCSTVPTGALDARSLPRRSAAARLPGTYRSNWSTPSQLDEQMVRHFKYSMDEAGARFVGTLRLQEFSDLRAIRQ
jgi:hypothetical protein